MEGVTKPNPTLVDQADWPTLTITNPNYEEMSNYWNLFVDGAAKNGGSR